MQKEVIDSYFREFSRILKPNGKAILHHAGENNKGGDRSKVSGRTIKKSAKNHKLRVFLQTNVWGGNKEYNCKAQGDYISGLVKQI
jgi:cyclopropane fatty-acyl-phospholipid synthase-like methyltransferase